MDSRDIAEEEAIDQEDFWNFDMIDLKTIKQEMEISYMVVELSNESTLRMCMCIYIGSMMNEVSRAYIWKVYVFLTKDALWSFHSVSMV